MTKLDILEENGKKYVAYKERKLSVEITKRVVNTEWDIFDMNPRARGGCASVEVCAKVGDFSCRTTMDDEGNEINYSICVEDKDNDHFEVFLEVGGRPGCISTISMGTI